MSKLKKLIKNFNEHKKVFNKVATESFTIK